MKTWILLSALALTAPKGRPDLERDLYKLTEIEDHRNAGHPFLVEALHAKTPLLIARALLALGRIGDPASVPLVTPFLQHADAEVRTQAAFALGLMKNPGSLAALQDALTKETAPAVRAQIYTALGRLQIPGALPVLEKSLREEQDPIAQSGLDMGFCFLFLSADSASLDVQAETLRILITQLKAPTPLSVSAAWALARYKGDVARVNEKDLIAALRENSEPEAKAIAVKALARWKTATTRSFLVELLRTGVSTNLRVEAASGLVGQPEHEDSGKALLEAANRDPQNMVRAAALTTLAAVKSGDVKELSSTNVSSWLQGKIYVARASRLQGAELRDLLAEGLQNKDPYVQREIIPLLPTLGEEGIQRLVNLADTPSILIAGAAITALHDLDKDKVNASVKTALLKQLARQDPVITSRVIDAAGIFAWNDALPQLTQAAAAFGKIGEYPVQESLMSTLAVFADRATLPLVEKGLQNPVRNVVVKAAEAYEKITGQKPEKAIPANNKVEEATPALSEIQEALHSEIVLDTAKGRIRIFMLDAAPLTATKVVRWARQGFYNGLNFHRVVPHWVVQGGDPRGDGEGGDGLIRDEVSMTPHLPYTLGIATAGKDTGSTQMFFNLGNNTRLDGAYSVFAQVIEGRDVVDRLEVGDKILSATVLPLRGR